MTPLDQQTQGSHRHSTQTHIRPLSEIADIVSGVTKGRRLVGETTLVPYLRVANVQA
ncbi:MAG: hypothetical protein RL701_7631, partial [Pseudomonadota bacterium]